MRVLIVGGGIVGLATAFRLQERLPGADVLVLEKEAGVGRHQSGRNSGVLHSGIYYEPGTLRARICRQGKQAMEAFCRAEGLPFETCGKVIVAVDAGQLARLDRILERGRANGVRCERIGPERLHELEPHAAGVGAVHVPEAGIVDFAAVCGRLAERVQARGGRVVTGARVTGIAMRGARALVQTTTGAHEADVVVNCAGLHSDRVARLAGQPLEARIVPFRGEYWELAPAARDLCRHLIYPVPDPRLPFLGVHFTRMIQGGVECGPNAVLALAREGYRKTDVDLRDLIEALGYAGFRRLAARYWRTGLGEMRRSWSKRAFVRALQRLVPELRAEHLRPGRAGVRAQALAPDGRLVQDFLIVESARVVSVCNAPSPAATASLEIGAQVAERVASR
jgi:L-2-hydroxyglutarate oxidase